MNKRNLIFSSAAVAVTLAAVGVMNSSSAQELFQNRAENQEGIRAAIENNDYQAWREQASAQCQNRMNEMTEEKFNAMAQIHDLVQAGNFDEAKKIAEQYDLPMLGKGKGKMNQKQHENQAAMKKALAQGDYQAWVQAAGDRPITEKITEANFQRLVEMHKLLEAGDRDGAQAIADELGIPQFGQPHNQGPMPGKAMMRGFRGDSNNGNNN